MLKICSEVTMFVYELPKILLYLFSATWIFLFSSTVGIMSPKSYEGGKYNAYSCCYHLRLLILSCQSVSDCVCVALVRSTVSLITILVWVVCWPKKFLTQVKNVINKGL